tara:strand:- start:232 stop:381 length:150 start_codon:yes stop_codon:yes gene_type:complete
MSRYISHWEKLKDIAGDLRADLKLVIVKDSYGRDAKRIIIEYEEDSCKE